MKPGQKNSYNSLKSINISGKDYKYYSLSEAEIHGLNGISKLPKSLKVLLENLLRYEDELTVTKNQIEAIKNWLKNKKEFLKIIGQTLIDNDIITYMIYIIAFWCKYDLAIGDTARLNTVLRDKGTYRGKVDFRFTGTSSGEYVKFSVPIEWGTSGSRQFDSAWFDLYSYVENKVDGDGYVIFDDIHFENISDRTGEFHNSGFEEWYNIGVDFPSKWRSIDLLVYDTYTSFLSTKSCVIADPESDNHGNSSITVQNYMSGANVRRGYAFIGEENNDYYTPHIPFMDTFKYLQGYYKYLPDGPDTARINFRTYATGRGTRSNNNLYLDEEKTEWTFFSLPLSYNATVNPDSAALIIYSANDDGQEYGINTRLFIDNLELVMEPEPLRLTVQEKTFSHSYYPNPTSGKVHIETNSILHTAQASNALGQLTNLAITNNTIDLAQLVDGLYFITIRTKQNEVQTIKIQKHSSY